MADSQQQRIHFEYTRPGETQATEFVVPINDRDLFTFRSETGYEDFCMSTTSCDCDRHHWEAYAGSTYFKSKATVVSQDTSVSEGVPDAPSHVSVSTEPNAVSIETNTKGARYKKFDISASEGAQSNPLTSSPISESEPRAITFDEPHVSEGAQTYDPEVEIVQQKQHRLFILHEKYGHLGFAKLNLMARAGLIPRELANVDAPTCPGCAYGKAHRKPWRYKGTNKRQIKPATHPGQVISVDQLASPTPGFLPTHRGTPTTMRYTGATVFVDHFSDFTYIHLMTEMNAETTVLAKLAFERECATHGVPVRHYHADNGLFDTKLFRTSVEKAGQGLTFCGVNAHHQNGKAERRIKDVTEGARTALIHAAHRWPDAIHVSLWPAALKHYVNLKNALPTKFSSEIKVNGRKQLAKYEESPISKMSQVEVEPNCW